MSNIYRAEANESNIRHVSSLHMTMQFRNITGGGNTKHLKRSAINYPILSVAICAIIIVILRL
jgi:hypothetical protein